MLSVFPSLLILGIFAPFILRVTVGAYFLYTGAKHLKGEQENSVKEFTKKCGSFAKPFVIVTALVEIVIGFSLIVGFLTQVMALLGMIYMLKLLWFKNEYPLSIRRERIFYIVMFAVLVSLLLTGPGVFAIDLPL